MDRRSCLIGGAGLALGGCARALAYGEVTPGEETWSESLMLLHFDARAENGFSVRVSRYPEMNATWVWCHLLREGRLYAFTERRLPCSVERNVATTPRATYDAPAAGVSMARKGVVDDMRAITVEATLNAHAREQGLDGFGETPIALSARFRPEWRKSNTPEGRAEWTGQVEASLAIGGRAMNFAGVAKAHEQVQTRPRFGDPFTYAMMWSPTASLVALASPTRRYGDWERGRVSVAVEQLDVAAPGADRRFRLRLADGADVQGVAHTIAAYRTPVFGRFWSGNIVRAVLGEEHMVGMLNDWRPDEHIFSL